MVHDIHVHGSQQNCCFDVHAAFLVVTEQHVNKTKLRLMNCKSVNLQPLSNVQATLGSLHLFFQGVCRH